MVPWLGLTVIVEYNLWSTDLNKIQQGNWRKKNISAPTYRGTPLWRSYIKVWIDSFCDTWAQPIIIQNIIISGMHLWLI